MAEARSNVAGLADRSARLASLLKQKTFPAIPKGWQASEDVVTWHSKVARTFDELKVPDPDSFQIICERLRELQNEYHTMSVERGGEIFEPFEALLVALAARPWVFDPSRCSGCEQTKIECKPRWAEKNAKAKCLQCVSKKAQCSLAWIPRQIWNLQFVETPEGSTARTPPRQTDAISGTKKPTASASRKTSKSATQRAGPSARRNIGGLAHGRIDDGIISIKQAIVDVERIIIMVEVELAQAVSEMTSQAFAALENSMS